MKRTSTAFALIAALLSSTAAVAQTRPQTSTEAQLDDFLKAAKANPSANAVAALAAAAISAELKALFDADQLQRRDIQSPTAEDVQAALAADQKRSVRVREIVSTEPLGTIADLIHAGTVLMHGQAPPDDLLTAHILFTSAGYKGSDLGKSAAAAALDRYLLAINQPQVFGTQSWRDRNTGTQKFPTNTALISDAIRKLYCVAPISQQQPGVLPEC